MLDYFDPIEGLSRWLLSLYDVSPTSNVGFRNANFRHALDEFGVLRDVRAGNNGEDTLPCTVLGTCTAALRFSTTVPLGRYKYSVVVYFCTSTTRDCVSVVRRLLLVSFSKTR